jgi:hypothetical protein
MENENSVESESPLKKYFNEFDVKNIDFSGDDYKREAIQLYNDDGIAGMSTLLNKDWHWRASHKKNVVASIEGDQGEGKSLTMCYFGLLLGNIYGVPFVPENIYWDPDALVERLGQAKERETFLRDEHRKANAGIGSNYTNETLADYEDQLRKHQNNLLFASVDLQDHSHFFCFETMHMTYEVEGDPPTSFDCILKTPRYTNRKEFVWRGYIRVPMPNKKFVDRYDELKNQHIEKLKQRQGGTLDPIEYWAKKLAQEKEAQIIKKNNLGIILPQKKEIIYLVVSGLIGSRKWTTQGYDMLIARMRQIVTDKYAPLNEKRFIEIAVEKEQEDQRRQEAFQLKEKMYEERRNKKTEIFKEKLETEKRRIELKEKGLALKEKELLEAEKRRLEKIQEKKEALTKEDDFKKLKETVKK